MFRQATEFDRRVNAPVTQRLGDVNPPDPGAAFEIGQGTGDAHHPVIAPRREFHPVHRFGQERFAAVVRHRHPVEAIRLRHWCTPQHRAAHIGRVGYRGRAGHRNKRTIQAELSDRRILGGFLNADDIHGADCAARAFARFTDRLVRQTDDDETRQARRDADLHIDVERLDALKSSRVDMGGPCRRPSAIAAHGFITVVMLLQLM